ncbi:mitochondrial fission 1 protein A isoform X2 [Lactuca sativa]|nr:mitochondrial fission 1 protein A isoform X2 [Lactuca sativa]
MEAKIGRFFESVGDFFSGSDQIPWCDSDIVVGCEREVNEAEKGSKDELKHECHMRLSWALVHSRRPEDVQRGIAMLEASLVDTNSPLQTREKMYLLAVGYYRSGDYSKSRQLVDRCLEIAPNWMQALNLKRTIEDHIKKDGVIGIGIAATTIGVVFGGIVAAMVRRGRLLEYTFIALSKSQNRILKHFA